MSGPHVGRLGEVAIDAGRGAEVVAKPKDGACGKGLRFDQFVRLSGMNTRIFTGIGLVATLLLGGCVTGNQVWPTGTVAPVDEPVGTTTVRVESRPAGALIVVQGQVVGHAPIDVTVPVTRYGFFPDNFSIRARFEAEDPSYGPVGVTANFGPLNKVPVAVVFNPHTFWPVRR